MVVQFVQPVQKAMKQSVKAVLTAQNVKKVQKDFCCYIGTSSNADSK